MAKGFSAQVKDFKKFLSGLQNQVTETVTKEARGIAEEFVATVRERLEKGDTTLEPLSPVTVALRASGDTKPLYNHGDMAEALVVWEEKGAIHMGLEPGSVNQQGTDLAMIGRIQEEGVTIGVTERMRGYFAAHGVPLSPKTQVIMVPPRLWWTPHVDVLLREFPGRMKTIMKRLEATVRRTA